MSQSLKPCPFCKSADVAWTRGADMPGWDEDVGAHQCHKCGATGPTIYRTRGEDDDGPDWNTRAQPPALEADVHFLTAALSWYDGTEASADVKGAWSRILAALSAKAGESDYVDIDAEDRRAMSQEALIEAAAEQCPDREAVARVIKDCTWRDPRTDEIVLNEEDIVDSIIALFHGTQP